MKQTKALMTNWRWWIATLLLLANMINYLDRQVLSLTWRDFISPEFHWNDNDYGTITACFSIMYAICLLFAGKLVDRMGTKKGFSLSIFLWSTGACLHAACGWLTFRIVNAATALSLAVSTTSVWLFVAARAILALGEAGDFPASIKTLAEYFPRRDRPFATTILNLGASIGAMISPVIIPQLALFFKNHGVGGGWEMAFIIMGALGYVWLGLWLFSYDKPWKSKHVNKAELDYITSDVEEKKADSAQNHDEGKQISIWKCFRYKQTWSFFFGKFFTDGVWWFYLFWTPAYFADQFGYVSTSGMGMSLIMTLYAIVIVISIIAGKLPEYFINKGKEPFDAKMLAMFIVALFPVFALAAQPLGRISPWWPAIIIGLAAAGHQVWSSNIFSTVSDMFPKSMTATVTGIGGMAGGIGAFILNKGSGALFTHLEQLGENFWFMGFSGKEGGYFIMFCVCALSYLIAWGCMKLLTPRYQPIEL